MGNNEIAFRLKAEISELDTLSRKIEQAGEAWGLPLGDVFKLNLALDELVTNVINHGVAAHEDPESHFIDIVLSCGRGALNVVMRDTGSAFNPLEAMPPDTALACEARDVGGLGIHLALKCMDSLSYERDGDINCLRMRKTFGSGGEINVCPSPGQEEGTS